MPVDRILHKPYGGAGWDCADPWPVYISILLRTRNRYLNFPEQEEPKVVKLLPSGRFVSWGRPINMVLYWGLVGAAIGRITLVAAVVKLSLVSESLCRWPMNSFITASTFCSCFCCANAGVAGDRGWLRPVGWVICLLDLVLHQWWMLSGDLNI